MELSAQHHTLEILFETVHATIADKCQVILHGGDAAEFIFYIVKGFVKGYTINEDGSCRILAMQGSGDLLPLESLFSSAPNAVYYETITPVILKKLPKHTVEQSVREKPALMADVLEKTLEVLRERDRRLRNLELQNARSRIVARLQYLKDKFGSSPEGSGQRLNIPVTYQDLADALNISRETANREFSKLIQEGLVQKRRGAIILADLKEFETAYAMLAA